MLHSKPVAILADRAMIRCPFSTKMYKDVQSVDECNNPISIKSRNMTVNNRTSPPRNAQAEHQVVHAGPFSANQQANELTPKPQQATMVTCSHVHNGSQRHLLLTDHNSLEHLLAKLRLALLDAAQHQIARGAVPGGQPFGAIQLEFRTSKPRQTSKDGATLSRFIWITPCISLYIHVWRHAAMLVRAVQKEFWWKIRTGAS